MSTSTNHLAIPEHDTHSDSDWLDIASTDRDSDDNDSLYSSRETDREDLSRSRSRRSSLSLGSSRDGDVDAWEGLIDDGADDGLPNDSFTPNLHVASLLQGSAAVDLKPTQETSPEELRINEGLDQSMISTLSSSRSSSLHASTVHNSSRDLRLSFPDPISSSCKELFITTHDETQHGSDFLSSPIDPNLPSDGRQTDDEEMLSASEAFLTLPQSSPPSAGPELKVFLYGVSTIFRWSIVNSLLQKVVHGAGLTLSSDLDSLQGCTRHLAVSGSFGHDCAFPRIITVLDRTLHNAVDDLSLTSSSCIRPLAIVFLPCRPLQLPEHIQRLPVLVSSSYSGELSNLDIIEIGSPQDTWDAFNIPDHQLLRLTAPEDPLVVDMDSIETIDSSRAYRAFARLWANEINTPRGIMATTHTLTIIAILSLVLGVVVRTIVPISLQQFTPALVTLNSNYTSGLFWQMFRPAPLRERLPSSTAFDSSVIGMPSSFKDFSLSVFSAESTSVTLSHANPTNFRRVLPSSLLERSGFSKELMLQPPCSVLPPDNRPKALSVIPDTNPTPLYPDLISTRLMISSLVRTCVSDVFKECSTVVLSIMNQDMQDIFDALDALVLAISRQTQLILTQATALIGRSANYLEKSVESFEVIRQTIYARNERARKRAKEIKERGRKWFYDASEVVAAGTQFSKGRAREMAEGLANRAQRAKGKAKEIAVGIQDLWNEHGMHEEALGTGAWYMRTKQWDDWVKRVAGQEQKGEPCKLSKRKLLESSIFC